MLAFLLAWCAAVQLRDPVQRVLSAYEFAIEGAALKAAQRANAKHAMALQAANQAAEPPHVRANDSLHPHHNSSCNDRPMNGSSGNFTAGARTEDVWPWSHLIPFLAGDMTAKVCQQGDVRVKKRGSHGVCVWAGVEGGMLARCSLQACHARQQ